MQERYLGDSHDFIKYALLRHLHRELGVRLGVNWYLTRPEDVDRADNNDGEKRHHLNRKEWRAGDVDLLVDISHFDDPANRHLVDIEKREILPIGTRYFDDVVPTAERSVWHDASIAALADTDVVFLDPDNGFEVPSMTRARSPKYALYSEAADHLRSGKTVVGIQFARQCDPIKRAAVIKGRLAETIGAIVPLPVIRGRVAPNILFFTMSPPCSLEPLRAALGSFSEQSGKVELIE